MTSDQNHTQYITVTISRKQPISIHLIREEHLQNSIAIHTIYDEVVPQQISIHCSREPGLIPTIHLANDEHLFDSSLPSYYRNTIHSTILILRITSLLHNTETDHHNLFPPFIFIYYHFKLFLIKIICLSNSNSNPCVKRQP